MPVSPADVPTSALVEPGGGPLGGESVEVVVFDMGGVLVRLGSLPSLLGVDQRAEEFWPQWLSSPAVRQFERGGSSPESFARALVDELMLDLTPEEFLVNFNRFPTGLYPNAVELVGKVAEGYRTAVLSNTNALHWEGQVDAEVIQTLCHETFLSYQLGLLKPDEEVYVQVADDLQVDPQRIVFLDDNQINVDGARSAGWNAYVVVGPDEAMAQLIKLGLFQ